MYHFLNHGLAHLLTRETPLLFQVEKDLGERINVLEQQPEKVSELLTDLEAFEKQMKKEGSFWDTK